MRLHIDFESRSTVDLRRAGVYRYAADTTTDVIVVCWAVDAEPVETWLPLKEPMPGPLRKLLQDPDCIVVAHNAGFERTLFNAKLSLKFQVPVIPIERWDCTAARAARMALPRSLDGAAQALGLDVQKDLEGHRLMMRMCRPRSEDADLGTITWWDDDARMARLAQYCATDVEVERLLDKQLRHLADDRAVWMHTELINDRGVRINTAFASKAVAVADMAQAVLNEALEKLTDGAVKTASNVGGIKKWLSEQGINIFEGNDESLNKEAIQHLLNKDHLPEDVKAVLRIRASGGKSSVAKYTAMLERVSFDGRVRGNLMYHGASTGRWSGAGVQLQNLPRATVKDWDAAEATLLPVGPETSSILSQMVRGTIVAEPGHRLIWADYAAIEARGVAWLAGQDDLVDLFARGGKVYEAMAASIYGVDPSEIGKDSVERFLGKTVILGCGYSMGAVRFRQACAAMGVHISEELAERAVRTYRTLYPQIPLLWRRLEEAAIAAVRKPSNDTIYGNIKFRCEQDWLLVRLPSGRKLFYREPKVVEQAGPFGSKPALAYMAVNSFTKKWQQERTFGGKLTENIVQGICRDLIAGAMLALEPRGYPVIASVHDEVICEVPNAWGTQQEMVEIMCQVPKWAAGFPIAAEAKEGIRYGK
jgi:DNA polymerase bacteriophage-type